MAKKIVNRATKQPVRRKRKIRKKKNPIFQWMILLGFVVFIIYLGSTFVEQHFMLKNLNGEIEKKEQEIQALQSEIKTLNDDLSQVNTVEFIEKLAREKLGMVKPREIIYKDKDTGTTLNATEENASVHIEPIDQEEDGEPAE